MAKINKSKKLIGLSFSRCMSDLLSGKIQIEKISQLITGTACPTEADFIETIKRYKELNYWEKYTETEVVEMYHKIKHLIWQPRLEGKGYPCCVSWWVADEKEIIWLGEK